MPIEPINYYNMYAPNLGASLLQGLQIGNQFRGMREANKQAEQEANYKQQQQDLIMGVMNNPDATYEEIMQVAAVTNSNELAEVAKYKKEGIDRAYVGTLGNAYSALLNKNTDAAKAAISEARDAAVNSKNEKLAGNYTEIYNALDRGENITEVSDKLKTTLLLFPAGREIVKNILPKEAKDLGLRKEVAETKEAEAKAETAFGAKELQRLQTMNAVEDNNIKKLEQQSLIAKTPLEQQKLQAEADAKRQKLDVENTKALQARDVELKTFGEVNSLVDDILNKSGVKFDDKGNIVDAGVVGDITGTVEGRLNSYVGLNADKKNEVLALLQELQSSARLQGIQTLKGTGSVTEAEGGAAANSIGNLSRIGSPEFLIKQLLKIKQKSESQLGRTKKHYQFLEKSTSKKDSGLDSEAAGLGL